MGSTFILSTKRVMNKEQRSRSSWQQICERLPD